MKNKIIFTFLTILTLNCYSQTSKIDNINSFAIKNSGAILDKNKDVDGYYFYYMVDKLKKKEREFAIKILDKNLVEVATKSLVDDKNTFLMNNGFNNQALMFVMANYKEKVISLLSFDKQANPRETVKIPLENKEIRWIEMMKKSGDFNILFPVDNKGFIFNKIEDNKKIGYSLKYYATDGGKSWEFNSPVDSKEILSINPIEANEKVLVALEFSRSSIFSRSLDMKTKFIDINTGQLLFEKEYSKETKPRMINNVFLDKDNNIVLLGEYFKEGDNVLSSKSLGLFSEVVDITGKTVKENFTSWAEDVSKIAKTNGSFIDEKGYVFFHNIVRTKNNDYYAIGEYYKRTVSAGGIAMNALSILGGGGGGGGNAMTKLTITNSVFFRFNSDFKLISIQEFEKGKSSAPSLTDFGSPQLNAHALKNYGAFDYVYTQLDKNRDRFYACFVDYERLKGEKNKYAFKTVIYDEGKLSEDKIYLDGESKEFRVLPGKIGNVLLLEYDKKLKEVSLHLEKLNIK